MNILSALLSKPSFLVVMILSALLGIGSLYTVHLHDSLEEQRQETTVVESKLESLQQAYDRQMELNSLSDKLRKENEDYSEALHTQVGEFKQTLEGIREDALQKNDHSDALNPAVSSVLNEWSGKLEESSSSD